MKSTLKLLLVVMVATILSAAVSCNSSSPGPTPGNGSGNGTSAGTCGTGLQPCNGGCVDIASDPQNCGSCGNICGAGQSCQVAVCRCQGGLADCGTGCLSLSSNHDNCGACNNVCGPTEVCNRSACSAQCDAGLTNCNGGCTNPLNDPLNCGTCGTMCSAGQTCSAGSCVCSNGSPVCNGLCTSVMTDVNNCGTCGNVCPSGQSCSGGVCGGAAVTSSTGSNVTGGTASTTTAGTSSTGAGGTGSTTTNTTGSTGGTPEGWWTYDPLNWHGCAWTGIDSTVAGSTTTIVPQEFLTHTAGEPYCVTGTVHDSYEAVALLGFNLNEDPAGADCSYDPATATQMGPPGVTLGGSGIAINFTKSIASTLRVQIQGPDGATNENDRWCATITSVGGKVHMPYSEFNTACWDGTGNAYNNEPISAVVFLVPGADTGNFTEFDFCINGFATGDSADDAPDGGGEGTLTGTIGGGGSTDNDFQRVKVLGGGKEYIIQNNNWGNPESFNQEIRYTNNSFEIIGETGGGLANGVPASFPSIFIGQNGDTQGGLFETLTDPLPIAISSITSLPTKFSYNRTGEGYNAAYDVWFSSGQPAPGYDDAGAGFLMVWLHKPSGFNPIGWPSARATGVSLGGGNFDVYVGPRNSGTDPNRPVVNYVATSSMLSMDFDLKAFIDHAVSNNYGIDGSWMLTDVFAGFEIWNGGGTNGLKVEEFTAVVNP